MGEERRFSHNAGHQHEDCGPCGIRKIFHLSKIQTALEEKPRDFLEAVEGHAIVDLAAFDGYTEGRIAGLRAKLTLGPNLHCLHCFLQRVRDSVCL